MNLKNPKWFKERFPPRFRSIEHAHNYFLGKEKPIPTHIKIGRKTIVNSEWESAPFERGFIWNPQVHKSKIK